MSRISFDRVADFYDETRGYKPGVAEKICDVIVRVTGANHTTRFLDMGIGTGRIALPFICNGYHYIGVDVSTIMMERLIKKCSEQLASTNSQHLHLIQSDITNLPLASQSVDVIIVVHVLHLVNDWQKCLREAHRVLRNGGWMLLARDKVGDMNMATPSSTQLVRTVWDNIVNELQVRPSPPRSREVKDVQLGDYLRDIGAEVRYETLLTYTLPPLSPRGMAERLKQRMFSSDWHTTDAIHAEAVHRLEQWLDNECPNPDLPIETPCQFVAVIARWPNQKLSERFAKACV